MSHHLSSSPLDPSLSCPCTHTKHANRDRTPVSSLKRFEWIRTLRQLDDKFVLEHSSLDAYLYLRFLRTIIFVCFIGVCITWPILFPVNATGGGSASQLDRLGFGNVHHKDRLYAHAVVAWVFFGFVMFVVARERIWLVGLRQAWYLSRANASRLSSRTVLYLDPPKHAAEDVQATFGEDARTQWVVTTTKSLDDAVESRDGKATRLELAEVAFLRQATKKIAKEKKKGGSSSGTENVDVESARPRERAYYIAGPSSDLIDHLRGDVKDAARKVNEKRESFTAGSTHDHSRSAIFVEYKDQAAAQRAYRGESNKLHISLPANMVVDNRLIGVVPSEVVWRNLAMPQAERLSKKSVANLLIAALIIFWSIPTALVGTISNVNYLASFEWLHWIKNLPDPILGLLTGFVPPLLTSLLASYVPIIMRSEFPKQQGLTRYQVLPLTNILVRTDVAKASGEATIVTAELQVQAWYYIFQLVQVFLVTALSSSATAFIPRIINEPHHVPQLLADNIPKSSNFYLTYFIVQGLGSSVKNLMNWSDVLSYLFYDIFVYKTPRDRYKHYTSLKGIGWGKVYPKFTNFAVIALVYSCISPLVLGFATVGLSLFYVAYKYNLLFVVQPKIESKGKCYTRALQQILAGVYIGELCLIGLFGLRNAKGPGVLLAVLFVATVAYHVFTNRYLKPLEDHFPDDLLEGEEESDPEQQSLLADADDAQDPDPDPTHAASRVHHLGREMRVPRRVLDPVARFFEPHVYASQKAMRGFLAGTGAEEPPRKYSDDEVANAYQNPSLRSKTPLLWLPKDGNGLSGKEIEALGREGVEASDKGAWVDDKGKVDFERDSLRSLPVWKETPPY